ncbi:MAG: PAS domain-containing protein [Anaerolineales bacterium]|nr:PAS domain-containing protein [Anaerolineales bacterium]
MRPKPKQQAVEVLPLSASEQEDHPPAEAGSFAQATLDALPAHICVLDENGVILAVNQAWREYTQAHPPLLAPYPEGTNYLDICDRASGPGSAEAAAFAAGIRAVLRGEVEQFSLEYACPAPWKEHWFAGLVTRFPAAGPARVVVSYQNITLSKQAEEALSRSENGAGSSPN